MDRECIEQPYSLRSCSRALGGVVIEFWEKALAWNAPKIIATMMINCNVKSLNILCMSGLRYLIRQN